jgi:hypothetical protein
MPNPSTLAADLEAELAEQHELLRNAKSKRGKGIILRRIREIEAELGIESQPYNSNDFGKLPQRDEFERDATSLQVGDAVRYRPDGLIQRLRDCIGEVTDLDYVAPHVEGKGLIAVTFIGSDDRIDKVGVYPSSLIKLAPVE